MKKILLFAGTSEGRRLAEALKPRELSLYVNVATEYGERLLPEGGHITVGKKRLNAAEMKELLLRESFDCVVDATHPFALLVSENIKAACLETDTAYIRLLREAGKAFPEADTTVYVKTEEEAAAYLAGTEGNVLITTGSKNMEAYRVIPGFLDRLYFRVLSTGEAVQKCGSLGVEGKHLFAMQGPFGRHMNLAMLEECGARYLVTKESGAAGGYLEKLAAAAELGVKAIVIGRPPEAEGKSFSQVIDFLGERYGFTPSADKRKVFFLGMGMGNPQMLTLEARQAAGESDVFIGAERVLEGIRRLMPEKPFFIAYKGEEILEYLEEHQEYKKIAVLFSGDTGFYSGAGKLRCLLSETYETETLCGISTPAYFFSRIGEAWENVCLLSLHGRQCNLIHMVQRRDKVFALLGGETTVGGICASLLECGLSGVELVIGENLSYEGESFTSGTPEQLAGRSFSPLSAIYIRNPSAAHSIVTPGIEDAHFLRDRVPMTKEEVRCISLSKLKLCQNSILYDVGAGTGSIAVEAALMAYEGIVYAVEKQEKAIVLLGENKKKFGTANLNIIEGTAPAALQTLPPPTHAFIGGSSGNMREILSLLLEKSPSIRIVITAVTLDTLSSVWQEAERLPVRDVEYVHAAIAKSNRVAGHEMMLGQNPVYIISMTGAPGKEIL